MGIDNTMQIINPKIFSSGQMVIGRLYYDSEIGYVTMEIDELTLWIN